jgi:hypothetical protein
VERQKAVEQDRVTIMTLVSRETYERLRRAAFELRISQAEILRRALAAWLDRHFPPEGGN